MEKRGSSGAGVAAGKSRANHGRTTVRRSPSLDDDLIGIVRALARAAARADHRKAVAGVAVASTRSPADEEDSDLRPIFDRAAERPLD